MIIKRKVCELQKRKFDTKITTTLDVFWTF